MLPVVKEELFSRFNVPLGIDTNTMITIHHHHLSKTVGVDGVVSKSDLVSFPSRIHHII